MARYGEVPTDNPLLAEFRAEKAGRYEFHLYPQLWGNPELNGYYTARKWETVDFISPAPPLPEAPGIYMFVVGPYCGGLKDHSYIFYVGKTVNIKTRYAGYLAEKDGKVSNPRKAIMLFLNDFEGYIHGHYTLVPKEEIAKAESLLKDNLTPVANIQLHIIGRLAP